MGGDLRDAWRWWRRRPLHPAAVVLLLAVGITANAVVFTFVERLLVSPLAVDRPETLVSLGRLSWPNYRSFAERLDGTAGVAAFANRGLIRTANEPEPVRGAMVSANYFSVLGVPAALGRTFETAETGGTPDVRAAVISDAWWRAAHGADPAVLGRTLWLHDVAVTVIGVAPPAFSGATLEYAPDVWIPFALQPEILPVLNRLRAARTSPWVTVFARRAEGTPPARLRLAASRLWDALVAEHPRDNDGKQPIDAVPLARTALATDRESIVQVLALLQATALAVFLIATANVLILVLAAVESRRAEFAVRLAHGARWWRLVRQQTTEHLILGGTAGGCGILLSGWTLDALRWSGVVPPLPGGAGADPYGVALVIGLSAAAPCAAGALSAVRIRRFETSRALPPEAALHGATTRSTPMHALLAVEAALSFALVCSALLVVDDLRSKMRIDPGFDADGVLRVNLNLQEVGHSASTAAAFRRALLNEVATLPAVHAAGWGVSVPFNGIWFLQDVTRGAADSATPTLVQFNHVDRRFFSALGIPVVRGRGFTEDDEGRRTVVVSQRLAALLWPDGDPVGGTLRTTFDGRVHDVVGVVGDTRYRRLEAVEPVAYFPPDDAALHGHLLVKTDLPPAAASAALRERIRALDARVLTHDVRTMRGIVDDLLWRNRLAAASVGVFGTLGLLLAGVGLYGAGARRVGLRRREIGVRLALGARRRDVFLLLLREGGLVLIAGALGGAGLAAAGWQIARHRIQDVGTGSLTAAFVETALVLGAVGVLAAALPARRAMAVDPAGTLRAE